MTPDEQLERWVAGESKCPNDLGNCCPDFSCCDRKLLADYDTRKAFAEASDEERLHFLGMFLGKLLEGQNVHIVADDDPSVIQ